MFIRHEDRNNINNYSTWLSSAKLLFFREEFNHSYITERKNGRILRANGDNGGVGLLPRKKD